MKYQQKAGLCYYSREKRLEKKFLRTSFCFDKNIKNSVEVSVEFLKTSFEEHGLGWPNFLDNMLFWKRLFECESGVWSVFL